MSDKLQLVVNSKKIQPQTNADERRSGKSIQLEQEFGAFAAKNALLRPSAFICG
jgi:hypothetical protein